MFQNKKFGTNLIKINLEWLTVNNILHSFIFLIISVSMICDPVIDNETRDKYAIGTLIIGNISPH